MKTILLNIVLFLSIGSADSYAQFIHLQINIETEMRADVIEELDFGTVIINSGLRQIDRGDPNMGVFQLRALKNQTLLVTLNNPEQLTHSNLNVPDLVPVNLEAAYNNTGTQSANNAVPFVNNQASFKLIGTDANDPSNQWEFAYIFIYGGITVGNITPGMYTGTLVIEVEYL
ncbi:MAG: hypothetical protein FH748_14530 [Balneolaceae bacterium]|nr:hypothetical protein [Balneolaceae bacterium]